VIRVPNDFDDQVQEALKKQGVRKFIGSSSGNGGLAMAVAAKAGQ
jgi:threonine dehydratase